MKTITSRNSHDSFSFSRRYFTWKKKVAGDDKGAAEDDDHMSEILTANFPLRHPLSTGSPIKPPRKKLSVMAVSKLRSALSIVKGGGAASAAPRRRLGTRVVGTLFGRRRGHVRFAFQEDFNISPAFMVELATPTSVLVKEMASGLVRIALECDKRIDDEKKNKRTSKKRVLKILEEPFWRAYCNGKKCGYAVRRECGPDEWKVLNAVGPITMGAGVLPSGCTADSDGGEMMYMRAKFERVIGSNDSEAFYMINPDDSNGGCPELSIYLLRV